MMVRLQQYHLVLVVGSLMACVGLVQYMVRSREGRTKDSGAPLLDALQHLLKQNLSTTDGGQSESQVPSEDMDWGELTCEVPAMTSPDDIYHYIHNPKLKCDKLVMVGGQLKTHPDYMVGEKWVCMSPRFNIVWGSCVALSFGIERDFSFDDDLDQRFNCKVFAFDPTINRENHRRSDNIMFYNLGIGGQDGLHGVRKMPLARYSTILDMLHLRNTTIDYLKLDIEGSELDVLRDLFKNTPNLLKNVKQIGMEIHFHYGQAMNIVRERLWAYFHRLECYGFKLMFSEINPVERLRFNFRGQERSCCYEMVWGRDRQW